MANESNKLVEPKKWKYTNSLRMVGIMYHKEYNIFPTLILTVARKYSLEVRRRPAAG